MLGPGLIAGAADNDPTIVATLAVIGKRLAVAGWVVTTIVTLAGAVFLVQTALSLR